MWISTHKVVRLTLILFFFFLHMYDYAVIDSGDREVSGSVGGFDPGDA
jgi:hypothetical protein